MTSRRARRTSASHDWTLVRRAGLLAAALLLAVGGLGTVLSTLPRDPGGAAATVNASTPCIGAPAPAHWQHVVVVMFENTSQDSAGHVSGAPFVNGLVDHCGHSKVWNDANKTVTGGSDGGYNSKPSYAVLTNGQPGTVTGITSDTYTTKTGVDNIFNRLRVAGRNATSYVEGRASGDVCSGGGTSSGSYHDPMRYYTDLPNAWCNAHDQDLTAFDPAHLPDLAFVIPKNTSNWHDNSIASGDAWLQAHLSPLLNSAQYASGDTAVFFLTDEDSPAVNALIAPSVTPGSTVTAAGNPVSHYAGLRTFQEMLGITPLLGDTGQAPSLVPFFGGGSSSTTTSTSSTSSSTTSSSTSSTSSTSTSSTSTTTLPGSCTQHTGTVFTSSQYLHLLYSGCWSGGVAWDTDSWLSTPWETFHHSGAWNLRGPATVKNTIAVNFGDSYRVEQGGQGFLFDSVRGLYGHDDCFENDANQSGTIRNSICTSFVIYSSQGGSTDGRTNTVTISGSYLELLATPTVYKGPDTSYDKYPAPGTGGFWKQDAHSPRMVLKDDMLVASVIPNHQDLAPPHNLAACSGVTVVWKGTVPFPAAAKAAWLTACPDVRFVGA